MTEFKLAWAWLAAGNPLAPYLLVTLAFYLACYLVRKFAPSVWIAIASVFPYADALSKGQDVVRQVFLALPQVIAAAVFTGLATGDMKGALFGALAGAGAPILHHVRDALPFDPYKGALGPVKPKGGGDPPAGGAGAPVAAVPAAPLSVRPPGGIDAEFRGVFAFLSEQLRRKRLVMWAVGPTLLACASLPIKPPCDDAKLAAIDAAYVAKVSADCLPKYDSAAECPELDSLKAEHRRRLREECGQ